MQAEVMIIISSTAGNIFDLLVLYKKVQFPNESIIPMEISSPTSPSRLVSAVIIPALYDLDL